MSLWVVYVVCPFRVLGGRQDNHFVQDKARREGDNCAHNWVQRRVSAVPQRELHSLGCGRPGEDSPPLETLLHQYTGM